MGCHPGGARAGTDPVPAWSEREVHGSNGAPAAKLPVLHLVGAPSGTCRRLTSSPRPPWPRASGSWCEGDVCLEPLTIGVADQNDGVRLKIYVRPGASRTAVGGNTTEGSWSGSSSRLTTGERPWRR